jgi:peptide/nickel transport system permease protein
VSGTAEVLLSDVRQELAQKAERPGAATWRTFRRQPLGIAAIVVIGILIVTAIAAPWIAHYPATVGNDILAPPSSAHWFGTDALGRDVFSAVVWGSRASLIVAAAASAIATVIGTALAVISAYFHRLDGVIGAFVDLMLALPVLPLMILVAALIGPSTPTTIGVLAAFAWPRVTRVVRSHALSVVKLTYIDAARLMTGSATWITVRHVVPAVLPTIAVSVVFTASDAVLSAAGLAFLGLGDPNTWSWGLILFQAQQAGALSSTWWLGLFPSLAILLLVLATTLLSLIYSDARNPKSRARLALRRVLRRRRRNQ